MENANITVQLKNGEKIMYYRETVWDENSDYSLGVIQVDYYSFKNITSVGQLIKKVEKHSIIRLVDDLINVDRFISKLIERHGEEYLSNEENYEGLTFQVGSYIMGAHDVALYYSEYKKDVEEISGFVDKIKPYKAKDIEMIVLEGEDEDESKEWVLRNDNGKLVFEDFDEDYIDNYESDE